MMPETSRSLATLVRVKELEEKAAAERMAAARERLDHERQNLTLAQRYLADYARSAGPRDMPSRLWAESRRFRFQLEQSVELQQAAVEHAERQAEAIRARWAGVRAERDAMNRLLERRRDAELDRRRSSEQRQTDEQALQQSVRQNGRSPA